MPKRIAIIQGHPDPAGGHLGHALADAYARGAEAAGHAVRRIDVAALDFPLLRTQAAFDREPAPAAIDEAQEILAWADHWVLFFPLWLGTLPAVLKGFLEQTLRPGFAFAAADQGMGGALLKGKSARIVVTMGMPALLYRLYFRAHGIRVLERNILRFSGIRPVRSTLFGLVEARSDQARQRWLDRMARLGARAG
jgi:putative NADPH-quinone reductase